ncbi:hypothetical protein [Streptomyces natalensis]|uniref:Histidine kinase n=1 Tax=Streptomyces natalensis ATCC 27448 TaxID=1240678 RepID=A0A0D7CG82_9ACTN|nr:hypothetical protein [Streptomyces natalensis]KIZ14875.1 hypothetical protein SNA_30915 [Streptomyces natalensis ATCC 27448]
MDLTPYIDNLRSELMAAAKSDEATALAERLVASVAAATRLTMLEVLSAAADEITQDLVPGSVEVRLRGRDPDFVVTLPDAHEEFAGDGITAPPGRPVAESQPLVPSGLEGPVSRINFRPPEPLKQRIEEAAAEEGLSVNAYLVGVTTAALADTQNHRRARRAAGRDKRFTGWVG